jgi:hypothetical protein
MTIYLTKTIAGNIHHFRVTVEHGGIDIVQGVMYEWIQKEWLNYEDHETAVGKQKELVAGKIKEGFQVTEFHERPENTLDVYDKAKWHYTGDFPDELEPFQGYVHTGMFLGWCIDADLISERFKSELKAEIKQFKQQKLTGSQIFRQCCDGVLMLEDLSITGNRFAIDYFEFNNGLYLGDYESTLGRNLPSIYHVADTWDNYEKLKLVLNNRFTEWLTNKGSV